MKNKNILYGLLGVGALAGLYFWNKKGNNNTSNEVLIDDSKKSAFSNEEIEKLSKEFADEFVSEAKKEITRIELTPIEPKVEIQNNTNRLSILENSLVKYKEGILKNQSKERLQRISNNYGNLYKSFKKSIPNFDNLSDLTTAKNILLKFTIIGDNKAVLTKEEQIFLANAESNKNIMKFGDTVGFDMSDIFPRGTKTEQKAIGTIFNA
jgi:gas vesicle protein